MKRSTRPAAAASGPNTDALHPAVGNRGSKTADAVAKLASAIDMRKIRAHFVAMFYIIIRVGEGIFQVTRPDRSATYLVKITGDSPICGCKDYSKRRGAWCKHTLAIAILLEFFGDSAKSWPENYEIPLDNRPKPQHGADGTYYEGARRRRPVVRAFPVGTPCESTRRNKARADMPRRCVELLLKLCMKAIRIAPVVEPKAGRPGLPTIMRLFVVVFRVMRNTSYDIAKESLNQYLGSIVRLSGATNPSKNCYARYIHDEKLTPFLFECLRLTARVVRKIEKAIVVDATAFSTCQTENWLDSDHGKRARRPRNVWIKGHAATGAYTNVVAGFLTSTNKNEGSADTNFFERLLRLSRKVWNVKWVLADKGYLSEENIQAATARKLIPIIPIVVTWKIENARSVEMRNLFELYRNNKSDFDELHRYRSKIESVFSAIKRTTGCHSRTRLTKPDVIEATSNTQFVGYGRINEILARCIAHNLRQLVMLEKMHDDTVDFDADRAFEPLPWQRENDDPFDAAA